MMDSWKTVFYLQGKYFCYCQSSLALRTAILFLVIKQSLQEVCWALKPIGHKYNHTCCTLTQKDFFPSAYIVKDVAVKQWAHSFWASQARENGLFHYQTCPITFRKSRRTKWFNNFISIQTSRGLNWKFYMLYSQLCGLTWISSIHKARDKTYMGRVHNLSLSVVKSFLCGCTNRQIPNLSLLVIQTLKTIHPIYPVSLW